jgi:predicted MFS family arabinose efflux permease
MAISGMTIGLSFAVAMLLGPWLHQWLSVSALFLLSAGFGAAAIVLLYAAVPAPVVHEWHGDAEPEFHSFISLLFKPALAKLNIGIFILHAIFTASFIVIPLSLLHNMNMASHEQWRIYLPALIIAFTLSMVCIGLAEAKRLVKPFFLLSIVTLLFAETILLFSHTHVLFFSIGVCLFFAGFTLLEAFLPSLISRTAPPAQKGSAMGIYSSAQFLGIFVGGALGGWLFGHLGLTSVYLFSIVLALVWFLLVIFI